MRPEAGWGGRPASPGRWGAGEAQGGKMPSRAAAGRGTLEPPHPPGSWAEGGTSPRKSAWEGDMFRGTGTGALQTCQPPGPVGVLQPSPADPIAQISDSSSQTSCPLSSGTLQRVSWLQNLPETLSSSSSPHTCGCPPQATSTALWGASSLPPTCRGSPGPENHSTLLPSFPG